MKGTCQIHGDCSYLYVKSANAKLCDGCLKAGFYTKEIYNEAKQQYPGLCGDAVMSTDGIYRYVLRRSLGSILRWHHPWLFFMLNPSTADHIEDDNTIKKITKFAKREGATHLTVVNLFAFRSKDPDVLETAQDPVGPENDHYIEQEMSRHHNVVAAWGCHKFSQKRAQEILDRYPGRFQCLRVSKHGDPWHPLYLPDNTPLISYPPREVSVAW